MARRRLPKNLRRVVFVLLGLVVVEYLLLPQIAGARHALDLLASVSVSYLLIGAALEVAAIAVYAKLTQAVLPGDGRPTLSTVLRIDLSTLAASHIVPGGSAAGAGLGYRLLTDAGVRGTDAGLRPGDAEPRVGRGPQRPALAGPAGLDPAAWVQPRCTGRRPSWAPC